MHKVENSKIQKCDIKLKTMSYSSDDIIVHLSHE